MMHLPRPLFVYTSTRDDALKRSALVASGRFWVCSVTWDDVQSALNEKVETSLADDLDGMCFNPKDKLPGQQAYQGVVPLEEVIGGNLEGFGARLRR